MYHLYLFLKTLIIKVIWTILYVGWSGRTWICMQIDHVPKNIAWILSYTVLYKLKVSAEVGRLHLNSHFKDSYYFVLFINYFKYLLKKQLALLALLCKKAHTCYVQVTQGSNSPRRRLWLSRIHLSRKNELSFGYGTQTFNGEIKNWTLNFNKVMYFEKK